MATSVVTVSAVYGCPTKTATLLNGTFVKPAKVAPRVSTTGSRRSRITMGMGGADSVSGARVMILAMSGTGMDMRRAIQVPESMPEASAMGRDMAGADRMGLAGAT